VKQLALPGDAMVSESIEFLRAWIQGDNMEFVSLGNIFDDAAFIGIFAADVVRHLVATGEGSDETRAQDLARALAAFQAEFTS